jgi:hypothetical protein
MYSIEQIKRLQIDEDFYKHEGDKYCLVSLLGKEITKNDVENHINFCILQIINYLKKGFLSKKKANFLINKIDAFEYSLDLLGPEKVVEKLNKEIIEDEFHIPHFNSLCVLCGEVYVSDV